MYTIMSISNEGRYFLVNGWKKHNSFWTRRATPEKNGFKTEGLACRSMNHLLKIMPDYRTDKLTLVKFNTEDRTLEPVREYSMLKPVWNY